MDIIICVVLKDYLISKKTIKFLRKNIVANNIYILTSKSNFKLYSYKFRNRYQVELIDEKEIVPNITKLEEIAEKHFKCKYRFGWYYQQFLKMSFALSKYAKEDYLIWDSDTIPLNTLTFIENGKMVFTPKTEYHENYFITMEKILGYGKSAPYSFIAEHMIINVKIMQELICKIESSQIDGETWCEKIISATDPNIPNGFSEFETYGTYCYLYYYNNFILKELRTFRECGVKYSRLISNWSLKKLSNKYDTISLEDWSIPKKRTSRIINYISKKYIYLCNRIL